MALFYNTAAQFKLQYNLNVRNFELSLQNESQFHIQMILVIPIINEDKGI